MFGFDVLSIIEVILFMSLKKQSLWVEAQLKATFKALGFESQMTQEGFDAAFEKLAGLLYMDVERLKVELVEKFSTAGDRTFVVCYGAVTYNLRKPLLQASIK